MGIQELIGDMGRKSSASPRMAGGLPAYTAKDAANAKLINAELSSINKLVKSSKANWDKMGAAKALINVKKALENVEKAEKEFNDAMKDGNKTIEERAVLYEKLAKAKNKQLQIQGDEVKKAREAEGLMGRAKNVLQDMAKNWKTLSLGTGFKVLGKVMKDTTENFDILAESSQLTTMSFTELGWASANYTQELNIASLQAAKFGVSTKESTIAFAKLSKVYGGTREAVQELGDGWSDMVLIAKISGIGMEAFTDLATQGMLRLGESMETTQANAVDISKATAAMNQRFGTGSANAKEFTNAVTSLAFAQGFYNQSTKLTIDTLAREVNMQLALGRSRSAAVAIAKENIKIAGEAGILGVIDFTEKLVAGYEAAKKESPAAAEAYLEKEVGEGDTGRFGAETDVIRMMLISGRDNIYAMQEFLSGSSAFQQEMLLTMRVAAAGGDKSTLLKLGLDLPKMEAWMERGELINQQLATIVSGDKKTSDAMIEKLFGETAKEEDSDTAKFIKKAQEGGFESKADMFKAYYTLADKDTSELADEESRKQNVMDFIKDNNMKGWFSGATKLFEKIADVLGKILLAAGTAGTVMGLGGAGLGIGALLATAGTGLAAAGTALMGIITGAGALMAAIAVVAAPVLAAIAIADMVHNAFTSDSISEWAGKTMDHIFGSLLDFSAEDLKKLGMGSLETPLTSFADTLSDVLDWYRENTLGDMWRKLTGDRRTDTKKLEGAMEGRHAAAQKQSGETGKLDLAGYTARMVAKRAKRDNISISEARKLMLQERGLTIPKIEEDTIDETVEDGDVAAKGKDQGKDTQVAIATGTVSGKSLILEVTNWDQIYAQAVESAA